jgi:hypothetical protein
MTKYRKLEATVYLDKSDVSYIKRAGDIRDFQVKCVCEKRCNNGWMRRKIENVARPIMIPLITGQDTRLLPNHQAIVARWAVLKAMIAEYDINAHVTTEAHPVVPG